MNKKIIGILLCALMLATIPLAAAKPSDTTSETGKAGIFGRTYVQGFILGVKTEGRVTSFFAIRVHYKTYTLFGEGESGVLMFQKISFFGKLNGHIGKFYVMGTFHGTP